MSELSDAVVARLRDLVERPEAATPRYEILERIGEGGMGVVYLARDRELGREVALKVLRTPDPSPEEWDRILREARILASLEHPGIAPVHDVGVLPDGRVFYVMKRVRGERLDAFARSARSRRAELLRVFRQVCDAVAFAHAAGVIHRDLKPQNVMLGAFGEVLVLDWGVAKLRGHAGEAASETHAAHPAGADTVTGAVLGTPGYMAPEQVAGRSDAVDERADVFGLGGVLCFLLTGDHPPPAGLPDGEAWRAVPAALRAICERARATVPEERYHSASELATDVANYLDALPVTAHRERLLERARRVAARHRTALLLVFAYLVMRVTLMVATGR
ncbi:MAG: serine/threonine-protein kinase [Gemmatimonadaceae bacterium]